MKQSKPLRHLKVQSNYQKTAIKAPAYENTSNFGKYSLLSLVNERELARKHFYNLLDVVHVLLVIVDCQLLALPAEDE